MRFTLTSLFYCQINVNDCSTFYLLSIMSSVSSDELYACRFINSTISICLCQWYRHCVSEGTCKTTKCYACVFPCLLCKCVSSFKVAFIQGRGLTNKRVCICIRCMLSAGEGAVKKRCQRWTKRTRTNPSLWGWWEKGLVWIGEWVKIDRERFQAGSLWG